MAEYTLTITGAVIRNSDGAFVPNDPGNCDYVAFNEWVAAGGVPDPVAQMQASDMVLSQDIMAQFTAADATEIQGAVAGNPGFWLLWSALLAQSEPMVTTSPRFLAGWSALVTVLGQVRMNQIAAALGANSLVA